MNCRCGSENCDCTIYCLCNPHFCKRCTVCRHLRKGPVDVNRGFHPGYFKGQEDGTSSKNNVESEPEISQSESSEEDYLYTMSVNSSKESKQSSQTSKKSKEPPEPTKEPKESSEPTEESKESSEEDLYTMTITNSSKETKKSSQSSKETKQSSQSSKKTKQLSQSSKETKQSSQSPKEAKQSSQSSNISEHPSEPSKESKQSSEEDLSTLMSQFFKANPSKETKQPYEPSKVFKQSTPTSKSIVQVSSTANDKNTSVNKFANPDCLSTTPTTPTEFAGRSTAPVLESSTQSLSLATLITSNEGGTKSKTSSGNSLSVDPQFTDFEDLSCYSLTQSTGSGSSIEVILDIGDSDRSPKRNIGDPSGVTTLNIPSSSCEKQLCKESDSPKDLSTDSSSPEHLSLDSSYDRLSLNSSPEHLSADSYPEQWPNNSSPEHLSDDSSCP